MKGKCFRLAAVLAVCAVLLSGCAGATSGVPSGTPATEVPSTETQSAQAHEDGTYSIEAVLTGGSGRASISSPLLITVEDGAMTARVEFSSPYYDYVIIDDEQYLPVNTEGDSVFMLPVADLDAELTLTADTTAMSTPHEIEYVISFETASLKEADDDVIAQITGENSEEGGSSEDAENPEKVQEEPAPELSGHSYTGKMELILAHCFDVYYYEGGFKVIRVYLYGRGLAPASGTASYTDYLLVPENGSVPEGLSHETVVIQEPLDSVYLVATSAMSLFRAIGAEDIVTLTGTDASGWYIEGPAQAIEEGRLTFAGKYSSPDYELLLQKECDLAVESTMILHAPEVQENLESFGIPVFIDRSSYESSALGRTEWIRLYGAMTGREEEADAFFRAEEAASEAYSEYGDTGKTVVFFSVNTSGTVTVRSSQDYLAGMIRDAGGVYVFDDLQNRTARATENISMETFYDRAVDADYIIYNATIEDDLEKTEDLLVKEPLFADFKAVQNGCVYQMNRSAYQSTDIIGRLTADLRIMMNGGDESSFTFLRRVP